MSSVLPDIPGLDVNGLLYKYTTIKNPEDGMKVHVSNLNETGDGYTFRETDDWSGVPGNTIVKSFPLANIPTAQWGDGSITVEGQGSVTDPVVIYSFRIDECYDEQSNPACPGYVKPIPVIPVVELYDVLEDEAAMGAIDEETDFEYDEDGNLILSEEEEEEDTRLEMGLTASANALTLFKTQGQSDIIMAINLQTNINMYYNATINGGVYAETVGLADAEIPDNKKALRNNLAQQLLHEEMIDMQYNQ
tara:strand:- start:369 stop:1115 length:747 start_codon:yes stop_codon:yes gene_type:complete